MLKSLIAIWLSVLALGYACATFFMADTLHTIKTMSQREHQARMNADASESGRTGVDARAMENIDKDKQIDVTAGIYIDRIPHLSMPDTLWVVDFYLWFNWTDPSIRPGSNFHVVDGEIISKELKTRLKKGDMHYELYRVKAHVTKFFNVSRFPRDDHLLALRIEDAEHQIAQMVYVADTEESAVSSRVKIPGYSIYDSAIVQKPHSYKTTRGDPRLEDGYMATYSQLVYGIAIREPGWALYIKMFLGTFAAVAICLLSFLIPPSQTGPRFSLGIGAFFAAVASTYVVSRLIPKTGTVGLTDFVMGTSLVTIFLAVLTSTMAIKVAEISEDTRLQRRFDVAALLVFFFGYTILNVVIAQTASL